MLSVTEVDRETSGTPKCQSLAIFVNSDEKW